MVQATKLAMKVTIELLEEWEACPDQVKLFSKIFPEGVELTKEALEKAANAGLNIFWFAVFAVDRKLLRELYAARKPYYDKFMDALIIGLDLPKYDAGYIAELPQEKRREVRRRLAGKINAEYEKRNNELFGKYLVEIFPIAYKYLKEAKLCE